MKFRFICDSPQSLQSEGIWDKIFSSKVSMYVFFLLETEASFSVEHQRTSTIN